MYFNDWENLDQRELKDFGQKRFKRIQNKSGEWTYNVLVV